MTELRTPAETDALLSSGFAAGLDTTGAAEAQMALDYAHQLLEHGPKRFYQQLPGPVLLDFLRERFRFALERKASPFSLRLVEDALPGADGSTPPCSVIDLVLDDRPFLIDSIQNYLLSRGIRILGLSHPGVRVERDAKSRMTSVSGHTPGERHEAHIAFLVSPIPEGQRQEVQEEVRAIVSDVVRCVDDFPALQAALMTDEKRAAAQHSNGAVAETLQWFGRNNFVFQGYLPFRIGANGTPEPLIEKGLGLFHPDQARVPHHEALAGQAERFLQQALGNPKPFLVVEETGVMAKVRHRVRVSVLVFSPEPGSARTHAAVVAGVFTDRSLHANLEAIPVVSAKVKAVLSSVDALPLSYKHKEAMDFINGLPRFELFRLPGGVLERMVNFCLGVVDEPRVEIDLLPDPATDTYRVLVALPGGPPSLETQQRVREHLENLFNLTAQNVFLTRVSTFRVLCIVFYRYATHERSIPSLAAVQAAVSQELLTRSERLVTLWRNVHGDDLEERVARAFVEALPEEYTVGHDDAEIMFDLERLADLEREDVPQFHMHRVDRSERFMLVLYAREKYSLSRLMPIFTNLRVLVVEEETYTALLPGGEAHMHTFRMEPPPGGALDPEQDSERLRDLIYNILADRTQNDPLCALALSCGFNWRQVALMQLYRNYLMQIGTVYTKNTINETLVRQRRATKSLFGLFEARLDPDQDARQPAMERALEEVKDAEREIESLTEDRIFKGLANLLRSTLRTNYYQDLNSSVLSIKLSSAMIEQLPSPRPLYEIYVWGPLMEGIHLRGDRIARGGIRYSDRPDDFRTEVLGLMATQQKKNALIVPLGSKGGFVVKSLAPYDGDARKGGDAQYKVFISALLAISDSLSQGRVVPPPRCVRHDGDDTYLVVAADKGTAHLSDTANAASHEAGYWLGDAFASGGSHGYDHKVVGITAKGAWQSVQRLFWERELDSQTDPVRVVGIGDMSGDVFGNGLLLSRSLRLVGAFDHRHIFLDPNPDPEASFAERERLFKLPRSAWSDYDATLISADGGVFPRGSKAIPLGPAVKALLDTGAETLSGEEVIRALLSAKVDLLWNGGIGTYIKAAGETHHDVGDPNNDAVRINAGDCRARVVGEGGNLGLTQTARIELDLAGVGLHSDAIDNAGGVNMSDQEVNLKILLGALLEDGRLSGRDARNALLQEMTESVTQTVLRANFRQVLTISMDRRRSLEDMDAFIRLIDLLATEGGLDRRTESIPNAQRCFQFQTDGVGMPRPVLGVLLAYVKMLIYRRLAASTLVNEPQMGRYFLDYFPQALVQRFELEEVQHALRPQIIATVVTNRVVDQAGMGFVPQMAAYADGEWPEVVRAYLIADTLVDGADFREGIYSVAASLPADEQYTLLMSLEELLVDMTRWLLLNRGEEGGMNAARQSLEGGFRAYCQALPGLLDDEEREAMTETAERLTSSGLQPEQAQRAALLEHLPGVSAVCTLADEGHITLEEAYHLNAAINERLRVDEVEQAMLGVRYHDRWQKRFGDNLLRRLARARRAKLQGILAARGDGAPATWVGTWLAGRKDALGRYEAIMRQVLAQDQPEVVSLAVVVEELEAV